MRLPGRRPASPLDRAKNVTPPEEARAVPVNPVAPSQATDSPDDPFPRDEVGAFMRRLPAYGHLAWNLARDPAVSKSKRAALLAAAGYVVSPIDLVPGFIPLIGQLDDLLVLLAALKVALSSLDREQRAARLNAVHLSDELLAEDAHALALAGAWLARRGGRIAVRVGHRGLDTGVDLARRGTPIAVKGARRAGIAALKGAQKVGQAGVSGAQKAGEAIADHVPGRPGAASAPSTPQLDPGDDAGA